MASLLFSTKKVNFNGNQHTILLQNENGPCLLLALANILILSKEYEYVSEKLQSLVNGGTNIPLSELLDTIAGIGMEISSFSHNGNSGSSDLETTLKLLPTLHTGLNINPRFDGSFQDTPEMSVFNLFKIHVIHMWLMPEDDPKFAQLRRMSYEEAQDLLTKVDCSAHEQDDSFHPDKMNVGRRDVENALLIDSINIKEFLESSPTQMTAAGIDSVQKSLKDKNFYILFRNNHFSTAYFRNGTLYTLVTDSGFANRRNIVWETLSSIDGSTDFFCDGNFVETSLNDTNEQEFDEECANDEMIALQLQYEEDQSFQGKRKSSKSYGRWKMNHGVPSNKETTQKNPKDGSNNIQNVKGPRPSSVVPRKKDSSKCILT